MIDPDAPLQEQLERQARIIDALVRRANRQHEIGTSAYSAFQSAIALQGQVWAKTRDLERAANELESVRHERERTRKNLSDALSAMEGGFALFTNGRLEVCNDLFQSLLPDVQPHVVPGLGIEDYFDALTQSVHVRSTEGRLRSSVSKARGGPVGASVLSFVIELSGDRWFQFSLQRTSDENVVILQAEITGIVRQNRLEKESLIDRQAHYLQAAFETMSSGICTFSEAGEVILHNTRFRELLGLPFTLVQKGTQLSQILDYMRQKALIRDAADVDFDAWADRIGRQDSFRKRIRHAGGRVLDLHAHAMPDQGFMIDVKDVTLESRATEMLEKRVEERTAELTRANRRLTAQYEAQARVEEELRLAKERAEAAVSSKTRFLAAASHDLLQPINAAKLLISTLRDGLEGSPLARTGERLDGCFMSIEHLLHALLDISRLDSTDAALTPSDVCLGTLIQGVIEDQEPVAAKKGVRLDWVPCSAFVRSDQRYLMRSIQNLVVNAIQYTDPGGRVLVGCRRRGSTVVLEVWDTGLGIGLEDQKRIFEEFARARNVPFGSGMGLGLSIVERTCRHMGHKVRVRSKPGVGSVFSIEMAMVPGTRSASPEEGALVRAGGDSAADLIALVVENDADVLFATTQKLESWGASVLGASSTEEALGLVHDIGMPPDIVLADYQLDGDDTGIRTIEAIRAATGVKVPAIMITADRSDALLRRGAEIGFAVLTKPVQLSRLRPLIDWKTRWQAPDPPAAATATDKSRP
ncbi:hybrid sensor histidine kinase/response regulator [Roseivivax isoporae]|uniref:histidine kinase n=1 Tax=Roseivivax isoporae LMG 25204 TaxID=1449351 RepID=X7F786_9RHOB|nr:PAS-domain containing protein [Roseivivax isoporae]ETX28660.1 histidine kinase [Roseivivax isoporae LMG 25204]